jgi:hypothetical protein
VLQLTSGVVMWRHGVNRLERLDLVTPPAEEKPPPPDADKKPPPATGNKAKDEPVRAIRGQAGSAVIGFSWLV